MMQTKTNRKVPLASTAYRNWMWHFNSKCTTEWASVLLKCDNLWRQ